MIITYIVVNFRDSCGERRSALSQRLVVKVREKQLISYTDYCLDGEVKRSRWGGKGKKLFKVILQVSWTVEKSLRASLSPCSLGAVAQLVAIAHQHEYHAQRGRLQAVNSSARCRPMASPLISQERRTGRWARLEAQRDEESILCGKLYESRQLPQSCG